MFEFLNKKEKQPRDNWFKIQAIISVFLLLLIVVGSVKMFTVLNAKKSDGKKVPETAKMKDIQVEAVIPSGVRRKIDGVFVEEGKENFYPHAVMIENSIEARPQAGLEKASVIYEALTESGITRFLAVFASDENIDFIGPVRSARPYFADWAQEYNSLYFHSGGSPEVLSDLKKGKYNLIDVNEISSLGIYFFRDKSYPRPHNLFTNTSLLDEAEYDLTGADKENIYEPWQFEDDAPQEKRGDIKNISIDFSVNIYQVNFKYDKENNEYLRFEGSEPHLIQNGAQLKAKNIIVQFVKTKVVDDLGRRDMETVGEGDAIVFNDGKATVGVWKKSSPSVRTKFYDQDDKEVALNAGVIWVEVVPDNKKGDIKYN